MESALYLLTLKDEVGSTEVGVRWHRMRGRCGSGSRTLGERAKACCEYAATDGNEIMKRLARRGMVRREGGKWRRI